MQRNGILNSHIAKVLADLGHTDTICIGDCGLPVPPNVQKIDLALTFGTPSFEDVVRLLSQHMKVEGIHIADRMAAEIRKTWPFWTNYSRRTASTASSRTTKP